MLVDPALSGLPAFLTPKPGLNSGFMIAQVTAAALVSENKQRAHPASVDSIPTSANQEDHVSMAAHGARRLMPMIANAANVVAIELLAAAQGCDFHAPLDLEPRAGGGARRCAARVPHLDEDRYCTADIEAARDWCERGEAIAAVRGDRVAGSAAHDRRTWLEIETGRSAADRQPSAHRHSTFCGHRADISSRPGWRDKDADWHVERLYDFAGGLDATIVRTRFRAPSSTSTAIPPALRSIRDRRRPSFARRRRFDGEPLYQDGSGPDAGRDRRAQASLVRALSRSARRGDRAAARTARPRRCSTIAIRSARASRDCSTGELPHSISEPTAAAAPIRRCVKLVGERARERQSFVDRRALQGRLDHHGLRQPAKGVHAMQMELACRGYIDEPGPAIGRCHRQLAAPRYATPNPRPLSSRDARWEPFVDEPRLPTRERAAMTQSRIDNARVIRAPRGPALSAPRAG